MRCEMCGRKVEETMTIKNRKNGNELKICRKCARNFGMKPKTGKRTGRKK